MQNHRRSIVGGSDVLGRLLLMVGGFVLLAGCSEEKHCTANADEKCCRIQTGDNAYVTSCATQSQCLATAANTPKNGRYPTIDYPSRSDQCPK